MYYSLTFSTVRPTLPLFFSLDNRTYVTSTEIKKNTWIDWHLIPTDRPSINTPERKTKTVDVPGMNGGLDFSESLTGYPVYENREGNIEFLVETGHESWNEIYQSMCSYLHGKKLYVACEDDPGYYYYGTITVDQYQSQKDNSKIVINYNLDPCKYDYCNGIIGDAFWDIFDFESDDLSSVRYTDKFDQFEVDDYENYHTICSGSSWGNFTEFPVIPTIQVQTPEVTDSITIHFVNRELGINFERTLTPGSNYILPQFVISQNNNRGKVVMKALMTSIDNVRDYEIKPLTYENMNYGAGDYILEVKGRGTITITGYPGRM